VEHNLHAARAAWCLRVYHVGDDVTTAFTHDGIDYLKELVAEARRAGIAPPRITPKPQRRRGAHRMLT